MLTCRSNFKSCKCEAYIPSLPRGDFKKHTLSLLLDHMKKLRSVGSKTRENRTAELITDLENDQSGGLGEEWRACK